MEKEKMMEYFRERIGKGQFYVPKRNDVIMKISGDVVNPHNAFGEEIPKKNVVRYWLLDDGCVHSNHLGIPEGWWFFYWTVHRCQNTSWLGEVSTDISLELPIYEVGEFSGTGRHDEMIVKKWGENISDALFIGDTYNNDNYCEYYAPQRDIIEAINRHYRENFGFKRNIAPDRLIYMGWIILIQPWGEKTKRKEDFEKLAQEERERLSISFAEFLKQHKNCEYCHGDTALGVFCYYAYLGEYDWEKWLRGQDYRKRR